MVGWLAIVLAAVWILVDVFNIELPWLVSYLPQSLLFVLGFLAIYLHGILGSIKDEIGKGKDAELLIGNERIYEAATRLIEQSPAHARFWGTSFWFYPHARDESPGSVRYFDSLRVRLESDAEAEYRRAASAITKPTWDILKTRALELLTHRNTKIQFYFENPLVLDCLIGETEAILGFPDRGSFPHLRVAILVRDPKMVESLRQWYQDFIWNSPIVEKLQITSPEDLVRVEERKGWQSS
ncbi:MAG: hypothetical protein RML33_11430 [Acidobacteriota bacterium]|nr:hypothetical protein [Acidobacteriota bacterium]